MATPAEIRAAVDTKWSAVASTIQTRQESFLAENGRYWQGKRTHLLDPADGTETPPTVGTDKPHYETQGWPAALLSQIYPMSLEIHQYRTPDGTPGYVVVLRVTINGRTWQRVFNVGPENYRAHSWTEVTAGAF